MAHDHDHGAAHSPTHHRTAEDTAAYLLPHLRPGMRLLDAGCGRGAVTLELADRVAPGQVVGIDASEEAVAVARESAASRWAAGDRDPSRPGVSFHVGSVYDLPYDDGAFDVVHVHQMTHHLSDPVRGLRELLRVCAPGGLLAVREVDYGSMSWAPAHPQLEAWRELFTGMIRDGGGDPYGGRFLRRWAHAAGLGDDALTLSSSTWTYATREATRWWGDSQADRLTAPNWVESARARGLGEQDLADIAQAWRAWGADPDAWFAVLHGELLVRVPDRG